MAHYFGIHPWMMRKLTPYEHDLLVAQTNVELASIAAARARTKGR